MLFALLGTALVIVVEVKRASGAPGCGKICSYLKF